MSSILGSPVNFIRSLFSSQDSPSEEKESVSTQEAVEHKLNPISMADAFEQWKAAVRSTKKVFTDYDTRVYISEIGYMEEIPCTVVDMINEGDEKTWRPGYIRHAYDGISEDGWQVLDMFYNVKYSSVDPNILDQWWDTIIKEPPLDSIPYMNVINDQQEQSGKVRYDVLSIFYSSRRTFSPKHFVLCLEWTDRE